MEAEIQTSVLALMWESKKGGGTEDVGRIRGPGRGQRGLEKEILLLQTSL